VPSWPVIRDATADLSNSPQAQAVQNPTSTLFPFSKHNQSFFFSSINQFSVIQGFKIGLW